MGTDGSVPMALDYLQQMQPEGRALPGPACLDRIVFAFDHYGAGSGERSLALQQRARDYAVAHGVQVFEVAQGIGHQLLIERGLVRPGQLVVGADSHAVSYGALNAFGTGIGSSDLAGILQCGQLWLKVPAALRVMLTGRLRCDVSAKDVALTLARRLGADGANYLALEFDGPGVAALDMDDRIVLANMSVEMGAKAGLFPFDDCTAAYLEARTSAVPAPVAADPDAAYESTIELDLAAVTPQVALPHRVDHVVDLAQAPATRIDMVYLGTCTGGRSKDFREALAGPARGRRRRARRAPDRHPGVRSHPRGARRGRCARAIRGAGRAGAAARLRRVLRHLRHDSRQRRERDVHRQPQFQGPHGQSRGADLSRVAARLRRAAVTGQLTDIPRSTP